MTYNYNFALGSVLFMGLTTIFYLRQKRTRDLPDRLYTLMLFGGLAAVLFDFFAAALEPYALMLPRWLLYAINMLFIVGEQLCLPSFLLFSLAITRRYGHLNRLTHVLTMLPAAAVFLLLILSPLGQSGIFYIDEGHIYRQGATHWMLYGASGLYMFCSCVILLTARKTVSRWRRVFILVFISIILCAMLVQINYPIYLLATSASALALTGMYYVLRAPGEQIDPSTGAFCRKVLPGIFQDLQEKKRWYTLVLVSILHYDEIAHIHGPGPATDLLVVLCDWLRAALPGMPVVSMNDARFAVVVDRVMTENELDALRRQLPAALPVDNCDIPLKLTIAALVQKKEIPAEKLITTMEFLFHQMATENRPTQLLADDAFEERCLRLSRLESAMEEIVQSCTPELLLEPVYQADAPGKSAPSLLDASLYLLPGSFPGATAEELLFSVKQTGNIQWYYRQLVNLVGQAAKDTDPRVRFCFPLFAAILIQDGVAAKLFQQVKEACLAPSRILLRLTEDDVSDNLTMVTNTISQLAAFGFGFRMDEFAEGYTDMSLLTSLPVGTVMIDASLLKNAGESPRSRALLCSVIRILTETGKEVVCDGVDTEADARIALEAGANLLHGKWCA